MKNKWKCACGMLFSSWNKACAHVDESFDMSRMLLMRSLCMISLIQPLDPEDELIRPIWTAIDGNQLVERFAVDVPEDAFDGVHECIEHAMHLARENCLMYRTPCTWRYHRRKGDIYYIERRSNVRRFI